MPPRHLYVHVPFCARRCSYCDFSIAVRREVPVGAFLGGIRRELDLRLPRSERTVADTLYFGGGTPSRLGGDGVHALVELVREHVELASDAEVTLEANPEDVDRESVKRWIAAGVNRVSLGVQSFDDAVLRWMHRVHDAAGAERAVHVLRDAGIVNLSIDLIFALPESLRRDWDEDLDRAVLLEPEHLSLYGLTVEPHTPLGRWGARGHAVEAREESYEAQFLRAHERLSVAGFEHYEVSNYGRPGRWSRHNSAYWTGAAYAGLGPSAHGYDGAERYWNVAPYVEWLRCLDRGEIPVAGQERLTEDNRDAERAYLGLRTTSGLVLEGREFARVDRWRSAGWAELDDGGRLRLTPRGWLRLDALAADLTVARSR